MKLLDLFCGEGGAAMGYHLAGFDVTGVDTAAARLEHYPFRYYRADAIEYLLAHGHEYDVIHASPPCTGYSQGTAAVPDRLTRYDRLIGATREALETIGATYVIENVERAAPELHDPILLCGRQFGLTATDDDGTALTLDRHRLFESNLPLTAPPHEWHDWRTNRRDGIQVAGVYSGARRDKYEARHIRKGAYVPPSLDVLRTLVGAPWMTETGCFLSIPPAYSEHLGRQLIAHLERAAA